jgi:vacuolar-type H+-ATPase subunit F/Vma7
MRLVVVGQRRELTGFMLAGIETAECASAGDAERVVRELCGAAAGAGLVILSPWAGAHAAHAVREAQRGKRPPVVMVMPRPGD